MPEPPHIIDKVNYIIDFVEDPCQAPWTVYLKCALPPAGEVVLALLDFDIYDIMRAYFRPGGLRSFSHIRRKRKKRKGVGGIPEIGEMIGKHLPGAEVLKERKVSQGVRALWFIDGVIQRLLWWWLVIDLTTDFLYEWTSLVNESIYCRIGDKGSVAASGRDSPFLALSGETPVFASNVEKQRGGINWDRGTLSVTNVPAHFSGGMDFQNIGPVPQTMTMRLWWSGDFSAPVAITQSSLVPPGGEGSVVLDATLQNTGTYLLTGQVDAGFATSTNELISGIEV